MNIIYTLVILVTEKLINIRVVNNHTPHSHTERPVYVPYCITNPNVFDNIHVLRINSVYPHVCKPIYIIVKTEHPILI